MQSLGRVSASVDDLRTLYEARYAGFRHGAAAILGSYGDAHDVVQSAFAKALRNRRSFRGGSIEAWVWRIVQREAFDVRATAGQELPLADSFDLAVEDPERDEELAAALMTLPPRRRLIVFLHYFADLSYADIAACCEIETGTVGATLADARAELRAILEAKEVQP